MPHKSDPKSSPQSARHPADRLDVDIRFLLANERTLLAWIRTGLTMEAGGLAVVRLTNTPNSGRAGIALIAFGALTIIIGFVRYKAAERAIHSGGLPKAGRGPIIEVYVIVAMTALLVVTYLAGIWK